MNIQLLLFSKEVGRTGGTGGGGDGGRGTGKREAGEFGFCPISFPVFILSSYILFCSCIGSFPLKICNPSFSCFSFFFFLGGGGGLSGRGGSSVSTIYFQGKLCEVFLSSFVVPEYFSGITLPHQHFPVNVLPKDPYLPPLISTQEESVLDNQE